MVGGPALKSNAVCGNKDARAVVTQSAVNENSLLRGLAKNSEELRQLGGAGIGEAANGNGYEMNPKRFGLDAFLFAQVSEFASQVDDGGNSQSFQFRQIREMRLSAAKKTIGDFSGVGNPGKRDFFGEGRNGRGNGGGDL